MEFFKEIQAFVATGGINLLFSVICAIIFVIVGFKLSGVVVKLIRKAKGLTHLDDSVSGFITSFTGIAIKALVLICAAAILGVNGTVLASVLGTAGLAAGLALQGSLSNFAGGVMILIFRPFKIGDYIDNHSDSGTVKEIGIFYTTITTIDNKQITIPNGALSNTTVVNYSAESRRRVDIEFSVSYSSDIDRVLKVMDTVINANALVLKDPAPFTGLIRQDASALVFICRAWCNSADYWTVYFDLNANMKKAFDTVGIEIPFNQLDVHVKTDEVK